MLDNNSTEIFSIVKLLNLEIKLNIFLLSLYSSKMVTSKFSNSFWSLIKCNFKSSRILIKESISIPVIAVGLITTASEGEFLLENSYCDFVAYGREFLRNPNFVFTAASELNNKDVINSSYQRAF